MGMKGTVDIENYDLFDRWADALGFCLFLQPTVVYLFNMKNSDPFFWNV